MTIRFLALVDSDIPGVPFVSGLVLDVTEMTPAIRAALNSGDAELVRGEEPERAVVGAPERAVMRGRA